MFIETMGHSFKDRFAQENRKIRGNKRALDVLRGIVNHKGEKMTTVIIRTPDSSEFIQIKLNCDELDELIHLVDGTPMNRMREQSAIAKNRAKELQKLGVDLTPRWVTKGWTGGQGE